MILKKGHLTQVVEEPSAARGSLILDLSVFPEGYFEREPRCWECSYRDTDGNFELKTVPAKYLVIERSLQDDSFGPNVWFWCGCLLKT